MIPRKHCSVWSVEIEKISLGSTEIFCAGLFVALTAPVAAPMRVTKWSIREGKDPKPRLRSLHYLQNLRLDRHFHSKQMKVTRCDLLVLLILHWKAKRIKRHIAYYIIYNHCYHRFTKDCSIHQSVVIIQSNSQCKQENSNINLYLYFSFVIWCIIAPSLPGCPHPTKETRPANGPENLGTCASSQPAKYDKRHNQG